MVAVNPSYDFDFSLPWWMWIIIGFVVLFAGVMLYVDANDDKIREQSNKERQKRRELLRKQKEIDRKKGLC